ncbi:MAG TPA: DMT family transporter [Actinomycetota bacterium]|nr:DMT family transporter [Actinomycetota bacterium]
MTLDTAEGRTGRRKGLRALGVRLGDRPAFIAALGALCIASSAILVRLADTGPVTVAVYRCVLALPVLGLIAHLESARLGPLPRRARTLAWIAGVFFAADLIFWHNAIEAVGAGLATVLGNLQVLLVGFAAWALLGERPRATLFWALPVVVSGVVLISGVTGGDTYGEDPALGVLLGIATSIAYAAFILILRHGSQDLARVAGPLTHATFAAAVCTIGYGMVTGEVDWTPGWASIGWVAVLALTAQVAGWLLISRSLPRLPAAITSVILLLQPVGALGLAAVVLGERPGPAQLAGAALILAGVIVATAGHRARASAPEPRPAV